MADDRHAGKYFAALGFFTFSMLGLVISGNLLVLFCFWELVGFSSYLLIGHWRERPAAAAAATKAFLFNRIGDALFVVGLMIIWNATGHFDLATINIANINASHLTIAGVCIFCGVIGKSAQLPLSTWLPDAMEGPTPVSALIHAATMVAAGVYLLLRIPFLLTPLTETVIALIGCATALYGGWMALQQMDLKKILAYSTISQLGLMMLAIGAGSTEGAFTHLLSHAFFKAALFLAAGAIIHSLYTPAKQSHFDPQDIRNMGGWYKVAPKLFIATSLAVAAMCGLPLFSGFISKEMIVVPMYSRALEGQSMLAWLYVIVFFLSSFVTVLYTYRLYSSVFFGKNPHPHADRTPIPPIMQWPVSLLGILSLWIFFSWNIAGPGTWLDHFQGAKLFDLTWSINFSHVNMALFSAAWTALALFTGWFLFTKKDLHFEMPGSITIDKAYDVAIVAPALKASNALTRFDQKGIDGALHLFIYGQVIFAKTVSYFDRFVVDGTVSFVAWLARTTGLMIRRSAGGGIQSYVIWSAIAVIIFIFWILK